MDAKTLILGFALALGFRNVLLDSDRLVAASFQPIHAAAGAGALPANVWPWLERFVPSSNWAFWDSDDKARKLCEALVGQFLKHRWPVASLASALTEERTRAQVIRVLRESSDGRRLLSSMGR